MLGRCRYVESESLIGSIKFHSSLNRLNNRIGQRRRCHYLDLFLQCVQFFISAPLNFSHNESKVKICLLLNARLENFTFVLFIVRAQSLGINDLYALSRSQHLLDLDEEIVLVLIIHLQLEIILLKVTHENGIQIVVRFFAILLEVFILDSWIFHGPL